MIVKITSPKNGEEVKPFIPIKFSFTVDLDSTPKDLYYAIYLIDGTNKQLIKQVNVKDVKVTFSSIYSFSEDLAIKKGFGTYKLQVTVIADKKYKQEFVDIKFPGAPSIGSGSGTADPTFSQIITKITNPINTQFIDQNPKDPFIKISAALTTKKLVKETAEYKFVLKNTATLIEEIIKDGTITSIDNGLLFSFKTPIPKSGNYELQFIVQSLDNVLNSSTSSIKFTVKPEQGFFDVPETPSDSLQIFGEIRKPNNLQLFDDNFFQINENGIPKNYIPIILQVKTTDKPKNKAIYKIILRDKISLAETVIDEGNLIPFLVDSKKPFFVLKTPQEANIEILLPLFKNGTYQVYSFVEADGFKGISHPKTFSVNITKKVVFPEIVPETPETAAEQILPPPKTVPPPAPEIFGTEGIGTIDVVDERIKDLGLQAPYLKTYLYQNGKNKVLFQIEKFFLISEDYNKQIRKLQEQQQYKIINNLVKELFLDRISANIYMTENKPETFTDIVNKSNLFKTLIVSNNELNFENYLDVNKDYYFLVEAEQGKTTNENEKIYDYSGLQKIKIIKDEELYFIENNQVATVEKFKGQIQLGGPVIETYTLKYYDFTDKEKIKTFLGKTFIESKFTFPGYNLNKVPGLIGSVDKLFNLSEAKFDSSQNNSKYIKLRITSKKTNRKIDINLNYSFKPEPQVIKSFEEIKYKDNQKLNLYVVINKKEVDSKIVTLTKKESLFNTISNFLEEYVKQYNTKNNLNYTSGISQAGVFVKYFIDSTEATNFLKEMSFDLRKQAEFSEDEVSIPLKNFAKNIWSFVEYNIE